VAQALAPVETMKSKVSDRENERRQEDGEAEMIKLSAA
jgi:hypothetical protein